MITRDVVFYEEVNYLHWKGVEKEIAAAGTAIAPDKVDDLLEEKESEGVGDEGDEELEDVERADSVDWVWEKAPTREADESKVVEIAGEQPSKEVAEDGIDEVAEEEGDEESAAEGDSDPWKLLNSDDNNAKMREIEELLEEGAIVIGREVKNGEGKALVDSSEDEVESPAEELGKGKRTKGCARTRAIRAVAERMELPVDVLPAHPDGCALLGDADRLLRSAPREHVERDGWQRWRWHTKLSMDFAYAVRQCLATRPRYVLLLQDDAFPARLWDVGIERFMARDLRGKAPWDVLSLYYPRSYRWNLQHAQEYDIPCCAQSLLFSARSAAEAVAHVERGVTRAPMDLLLHEFIGGAAEGGRQRRAYVHVPSLFQHTGRVRSTGQGREKASFHEDVQFPDERVDDPYRAEEKLALLRGNAGVRRAEGACGQVEPDGWHEFLEKQQQDLAQQMAAAVHGGGGAGDVAGARRSEDERGAASGEEERSSGQRQGAGGGEEDAGVALSSLQQVPWEGESAESAGLRPKLRAGVSGDVLRRHFLMKEMVMAPALADTILAPALGHADRAMLQSLSPPCASTATHCHTAAHCSTPPTSLHLPPRCTSLTCPSPPTISRVTISFPSAFPAVHPLTLPCASPESRHSTLPPSSLPPPRWQALLTHLRTRALLCPPPPLPPHALPESPDDTAPSSARMLPPTAEMGTQGGSAAQETSKVGQEQQRQQPQQQQAGREGGQRESAADLASLRASLAASRSPQDCWSRTEMHAYMPPAHSPAPSAAFTHLLRRYQALHRRCTARLDFKRGLPPADALRAVVAAGSAEGHAPCQYLFYRDSIAGVGNRMLALVSAFTLALLTNRTLLLSAASFPATAFCQPFNASDWTIPAAHFEAIVRDVGKDAKPNEFPPSNRSLHLDYPSGFWWNVVCDDEQQRMARTPVLLFTSYFYTLPALYFRPSFQAALDSWFPDRRPFTHVARWLLHPANFLWLAVSQAFSAYLSPHSPRLALQIRPVEETEEDIVPRILTCAHSIARLLPAVGLNDYEDGAAMFHASTNATTTTATTTGEGPPAAGHGRSAAVIVASLSTRFGQQLRLRFVNNPSADGSLIAVHWVHAEESQKFDWPHFGTAVIDIWLLALCDSFLVTEGSTLGMVAAGLAGATPHIMNIMLDTSTSHDWRSNGRPECQLGGAEPCLKTHHGHAQVLASAPPTYLTAPVPSNENPFIDPRSSDPPSSGPPLAPSSAPPLAPSFDIAPSLLPLPTLP
ncbi:unnamed protein product [Closterium sp. Naga37s-1]|nr:unnamed protein product [Closterium sp. Naga37s-1]